MTRDKLHDGEEIYSSRKWESLVGGGQGRRGTRFMLSYYLVAPKLCRLLRISRRPRGRWSSVDGMPAWSPTKCIVTWLSIGFLPSPLLTPRYSYYSRCVS